jgi:GAF domain-containing protein
VPYLRCPSCYMTSYAPRQGGTCANCGTPLQRPDTNGSGDFHRRLDTLLRLTRELLDADIAVLSEIRDGQETTLRTAGVWPSAEILEGFSAPLEDTICQRMLDGRIESFIRDVATDERLADLALPAELGIRGWIGVPIKPSDAELYVLCCLAREARPSLGAREVRLLRGLGESVQVELQLRT